MHTQPDGLGWYMMAFQAGDGFRGTKKKRARRPRSHLRGYKGGRDARVPICGGTKAGETPALAGVRGRIVSKNDPIQQDPAAAFG